MGIFVRTIGLSRFNRKTPLKLRLNGAPDLSGPPPALLAKMQRGFVVYGMDAIKRIDQAFDILDRVLIRLTWLVLSAIAAWHLVGK